MTDKTELAKRLIAECQADIAGLESIKLPPHDPTIAIEELLSGYLPDDREDHWEAIQAYADIHARRAVLINAPAQQAEPMCETMHRPKAECGCPDCGSSLIDWPADEPAPAQDEREFVKKEICPNCEHQFPSSANPYINQLRAELATRPAQTEQPEQSGLVTALEYYANGDHLLLADADAWDTCSGEPMNFLHDEAGTASIEDGSIAKVALEAYRAALVQGGRDD